MKKYRKSFIVGLLLSAACLVAPAQVPPPAAAPPADLLTNLPTVALGSETIGVATGPVLHGAGEQSVDNALLIDYTFRGSFFLRGELQSSAGASSVVNSLGIGGGIAKSWPAARAYGFMEGRRNWSKDKWEGVAGLGAAWTPAQTAGSFLSQFSLFAEPRLVITGVRDKPAVETVTGIRYSF